MNVEGKILELTINNWNIYLRRLKSDYKTLTRWLLESRIKGIWLECHKDDLSDKFNKKTKSKGAHANFIQY